MEELTQVIGTQDIYDPRRMGINNSGLSEEDLADVLCILHPATPTAFKIVENTAQRSPQFVLSHVSFADYPESVTAHPSRPVGGEEYDEEIDDDDVYEPMQANPPNVEEADTFIINNHDDRPPHAMDIALRLSATLQRPELGFVFGRNPQHCDVILDGDSSRRISNLHFRVFINNQGVLMLEDASTNGTIVDEQILTGRPEARRVQGPSSRMIVSGSIVQIVSPKPNEIIKFVVRIPNREGFEGQFNHNFQLFMERFRVASENADKRLRHNNGAGGLGHYKTLFDYRRVPPAASGSLRPPVHSVHFGMHWSGGEKYSVVGNIGKGAFATVYQIATKENGQLFAAKELDKRRCMKNGVLDRKVSNEMSIMRQVSHPNIVQYIEYHEIESYLYIIMEFVPGGDLQQYLNARGQLSEPIAKTMSYQVLSALAYLHRNKITHRDIKPDNILLANTNPENFTIKLSDFGLSKVVADDKETFLKTFCGTLLYCAPEVFPHYDAHMAARGKKRTRAPSNGQAKQYHSYSQSVDIWSFAAVLWFSLCLSPPFEGVADATGKGMFDRIMATPLDTRVLLRYKVSDDAINLLADMLNTDPSLRPTPAQCLEHEWFGGRGRADAIPPARGLVAIAEEREAEAPDVASLSIGEPSQSSQLSINSEDIHFFDPPTAKRHKSGVFAHNGAEVAFHSSSEVVLDRIPIVNQDQPAESPKAATKLFGEISQSKFVNQGQPEPPVRMSGSFGSAGSFEPDEAKAQATEDRQKDKVASPSLLGTEQLVRDLKMTSPRQSITESSHASMNSQNEILDSREEPTPRANPPKKKFNRQINLGYPASLYWDPADPTTHTIEYSSRVSGHDFAKHPFITFPPGTKNIFPTLGKSSKPVGEQSIAEEPANIAKPQPQVKPLRQGRSIDNANGSPDFLPYRSDDDDVLPEAYDDDSDFDPAMTPTPTPHVPRSFPQLGKIMSTADSFLELNLVLSRKMTDWGRLASCVYTYPDSMDTRIPKRGIIICFHAKGINDYADDDERWTLLPDLQPYIMTEKRGGLHVNGIPLPKNEDDRNYFGKLYTGDEIDVYTKYGEPPLKLVCDFSYGLGRTSRPITMPPFVVDKAVRAPERLDDDSERNTASQLQGLAQEQDTVAGAAVGV